MPVHNADVAALFEEIADLLEIEGSNPFRIRAYRNAVRTLRDFPHEVGVMLSIKSIPTTTASLNLNIFAMGSGKRAGDCWKRKTC